MANTIHVDVNQVGSTTSQGVIREHTVFIDRPAAKGGNDRGAMGGELLLASLGGCFMSNMLAAIQAREADVTDVVVSVDGTLDGSPASFTQISMAVSANCSDRDLLQKLVTISERGCIVANTLKGAVGLTISVV